MYGNYVESLGNPNGGLGVGGALLQPEAGEQYEAGFKTELFDKKLTASVAFYHLTKQNIAVPLYLFQCRAL